MKRMMYVYRNAVAHRTDSGSWPSGDGHYRLRSLPEVRRAVDRERELYPASGNCAVQDTGWVTPTTRRPPMPR